MGHPSHASIVRLDPSRPPTIDSVVSDAKRMQGHSQPIYEKLIHKKGQATLTFEIALM
jgi:hypothetical protein